MELSDAIAHRRMTRNFTGAPLGPGTVDSLLRAALRAPSAGNTQGREFVVLNGRADTSLYWDAVTDEEWRATSRRFAGLRKAPVIVLPFADPQAYVERYREPDKSRAHGDEVEWTIPYWLVDTAFSVMSLLLAASDRGVGAAFLGNFRGEGALHRALGVPDRFCWLGAVLLGEPATPDPPSDSLRRPRRTLENTIHRGRW